MSTRVHALMLAIAASIPTPMARAETVAAIEPSAGRPEVTADWWKMFRDPQLDALVSRAHAGNPGIAQYAARVAAARAAARIDAAAAVPRLDVSAGATQAGGPLINAAGGSGSLFTTRAAVSWEVDLFGKTSRLVRAGRLDADAAAAQLAHARLLVEADTAVAYFDTLSTAARVRQESRRLALADEAAKIASRSIEIGLGSRLDAAPAVRTRAESALALAEATRSHAEALHRLTALTGQEDVAEPGEAGERALPEVPEGLPAHVLERRPDLIAAKTRVIAAQQRKEAARREWLPDIALTASGGGASSSLAGLLDAASRGYGLGLLLASPLLDGGRHRARVAGAGAAVNLAEAEYRESVLAALRETADCLAVLEEVRSRRQTLTVELDRMRQDHAALRAGVAAGLRSHAAEIASEFQELSAEQARTAAESAASIATVRLVKAIGGGWEAPTR